jgi:hypothetical protein
MKKKATYRSAVRQHGVGKRRTWRKLHLCVDEATLEIISVVASTNDVSDAEALPDLLQDAPGEIEQVSADGAYDQRRCYGHAQSLSGEGCDPASQGEPRPQQGGASGRDENLRRVRKVGRKEWKQESDYHRRSLAETMVFRFKAIFGDRSQTRQIDNHFKELMLKSAISNQMTHLGMPDSVGIAG